MVKVGGLAAKERASMPPGAREEISATAAAERCARDGLYTSAIPIRSD